MPPDPVSELIANRLYSSEYYGQFVRVLPRTEAARILIGRLLPRLGVDVSSVASALASNFSAWASRESEFSFTSGQLYQGSFGLNCVPGYCTPDPTDTAVLRAAPLAALPTPLAISSCATRVDQLPGCFAMTGWLHAM
jgi:hypothetical protein